MRAGELRNKITIQQQTQSLATSGQPTDTWTDFATVWAAINPVGGGETWRAQQSNPLLTHEIKIRWMRGLTPKMRVKYIDAKDSNRVRYFGIDAIRNMEERNVEIRLMCIEDVDG
jgi:SPP1 family predicted phage head-tail adaptor